MDAANRLLEGVRSQSVFIDEAAQALEAASWIAIRKADRVIFAGDHCQLPPTIKCMEAARAGLVVTLMEKVVKHRPDCVQLLDTQYRMHESIAKFPSDWFYQGQLKSAPSVGFRSILSYEAPMVWLDTSDLEYNEQATADLSGRYNNEEAKFIVKALEDYTEEVGIKRIQDERIDFGLISPYKNQVQRLRQLVKQSAGLKPIKKSITINTIDGFQGQERDVVLISLVRSNEEGNIGFLRELRRMNVAITRAKMKLIIVGAADTLTRHPFYKKLYEYVERDGKVVRSAPPAKEEEQQTETEQQ